MGRMVKRTNKQVSDIVNTEGLGYSIESYLSHEDIRDKELAELWKKAHDSMLKVKEYLDEETRDIFLAL